MFQGIVSLRLEVCLSFHHPFVMDSVGSNASHPGELHCRRRRCPCSALLVALNRDPARDSEAVAVMFAWMWPSDAACVTYVWTRNYRLVVMYFDYLSCE